MSIESMDFHPLKTTEVKKELLKERAAQIDQLLEEQNPNEVNKIIYGLNEGDFKWEDKMQRKLMKFYYDNKDEDLDNSRKEIFDIISKTKKKQSQKGRISEFNQVFKTSYNGPLSDDGYIENPKTTADFFNNAIETGNTEEAERLLEVVREEGSDEKTDHREKSLFDYCCENEDYDGANRVIENMTPNSHNKKYNSKNGRINYLSELIEK